MTDTVVLARAYGGEPLQRIAVGRGRGAIHIANPEYMDAIKDGRSCPIGFPDIDIFCFDSMVYENLRRQWERDGVTDPKVWNSLLPYRA